MSKFYRGCSHLALVARTAFTTVHSTASATARRQISTLQRNTLQERHQLPTILGSNNGTAPAIVKCSVPIQRRRHLCTSKGNKKSAANPEDNGAKDSGSQTRDQGEGPKQEEKQKWYERVADNPTLMFGIGLALLAPTLMPKSPKRDRNTGAKLQVGQEMCLVMAAWVCLGMSGLVLCVL